MDYNWEGLFKVDLLDDLRTSIDSMDTSLMLMLSEMLKTMLKLGHFSKKEYTSLLKYLSQSPQRNYYEPNIDYCQPDFFNEILLIVYKEGTNILQLSPKCILDDLYYENGVESLKLNLDFLENTLIQILKNRFFIVQRIGTYKKLENINILMPKRWENILKDKQAQAKNLFLNSEFIAQFFNVLHEESIFIQQKVNLQ